MATLTVVMHKSVEKLSHYRCGVCSEWFSIGDGKDRERLFCPACGSELAVVEMEYEDVTKVIMHDKKACALLARAQTVFDEVLFEGHTLEANDFNNLQDEAQAVLVAIKTFLAAGKNG